MTAGVSMLEAARLGKSLGARLAGEARIRGVTADLVRKQYISTIFLSRIFQHEDPHGCFWAATRSSSELAVAASLGASTWPAAPPGPTPRTLSELQQLASRPFNGDPSSSRCTPRPTTASSQ